MSESSSTEKASGKIFTTILDYENKSRLVARKVETKDGFIFVMDHKAKELYDKLVSLEATTALLEALETLSPSETVTKLLNHSRSQYQSLIKEHNLS